MQPKVLRVIGPGRAGLSLSAALARVGWSELPPLGRDDDFAGAAQGVDLLVIATPDAAIESVAASVDPDPECVVVHLAGSMGPGILDGHPRAAALHPLVSLPDPRIGSERLAAGAWFGVAGDPMVRSVVEDLGGRCFEVADEDRVLYHAAATIASNHLVALLGQVERVSSEVEVPFAAFLDLVRATVENVAALGPAAALTGPVRRGDWDTVAAHVEALAEPERRAYEAMANEAARLTEMTLARGHGGRVLRRGGRESAAASGKIPPTRTPGPPGRALDGLVQIGSVEGFRKAMQVQRDLGLRVGLVPTMGYLHDGHASLIRRAAAECDVVAVTVFVNPLQFGPSEDLGAYPRDLEGDRRTATEAGASHLFVPTTEEMWPGGGPTTTVSAGPLGEILDGESRPGHFDGVATVVAKLFAIAGGCSAYFGEKDYQQLLVIRRLAADLGFGVSVIGCPTVREDDGLAMSSRNSYLTPGQRAVASVIHRALQSGRHLLEAGERSPAVVASAVAAELRTEPELTLEYAVAVQAEDLSTHNRLHGEVRLLIAAGLDRARLIDNMGVTI